MGILYSYTICRLGQNTRLTGRPLGAAYVSFADLKRIKRSLHWNLVSAKDSFRNTSKGETKSVQLCCSDLHVNREKQSSGC